MLLRYLNFRGLKGQAKVSASYFMFDFQFDGGLGLAVERPKRKIPLNVLYRG